MTYTLISVALGGALGAVGRFLVGLLALRVMGAGFPWATLGVNVVGSFAMGILFVLLMHSSSIRLNLFLLTGVLGGFTTFSAFSLDAIALYERGAIGLSLTYVFVSVAASLAALVLGLFIARGLWA